MPIGHLLEEFRDGATGEGARGKDISAGKSKTYEDGYQDGWNAAAEKFSEEKGSISSDLAKNLQDLTFTFTEAKQASMSEFNELVEVLVSKILPEIARESLGIQLVQHLRQAALNHDPQSIQLVVSPSDAAAVQSILTKVPGVDSEIQQDADLPPGTVQWCIGESEKQFDSQDLMQNVEAALRGFMHEAKEDKKYA